MRRSSLVSLIAAAAIGATVASTFVSPWVSARGIRLLFDADARRTRDEGGHHAPTAGIDARLGIEYGHGQAFDLYRPSGIDTALPVIIWVHGGAWISGSRDHIGPFARILASRGFAVVAVDYSLAPESRYPSPLVEVADALRTVERRADDFGVDPTRIVLAGDSAGAQIVSEFVVDSPMALEGTALAGVVLACGIYDLDVFAEARGIGGWGIKAALWAYLGERDWEHTEAARAMSTRARVTADFPPAFLCAGMADDLTRGQSIPMAARLAELGVDVTTDFPERMPHEYQFHLDAPQARQTLENMVEFLRTVTGKP